MRWVGTSYSVHSLVPEVPGLGSTFPVVTLFKIGSAENGWMMFIIIYLCVNWDSDEVNQMPLLHLKYFTYFSSIGVTYIFLKFIRTP